MLITKLSSTLHSPEFGTPFGVPTENARSQVRKGQPVIGEQQSVFAELLKDDVAARRDSTIPKLRQ